MTFAKSERLGYLTSCPSNIGTGLRSSVHVDLENLLKFPEVLGKLSKRFEIQVRNEDGETGSKNSTVRDISNIRRLGRSEAELIEDSLIISMGNLKKPRIMEQSN